MYGKLRGIYMPITQTMSGYPQSKDRLWLPKAARDIVGPRAPRASAHPPPTAIVAMAGHNGIHL